MLLLREQPQFGLWDTGNLPAPRLVRWRHWYPAAIPTAAFHISSCSRCRKPQTMPDILQETRGQPPNLAEVIAECLILI